VLARAGDFSNGILFYRGSVRSHSRAGIGLGITIKYPQCTTTQRPKHCATHNERRRGQRPQPMPEITHLPFTTSALHSPCLARTSFDIIRQQKE
jgi:hypothetical protein